MPEPRRYACRNLCSRPEYRDRIIADMKRQMLDSIKDEILDGNTHAIRFSQYENWSYTDMAQEITMELLITPMIKSDAYYYEPSMVYSNRYVEQNKPDVVANVKDTEVPIQPKIKTIVIDVEADI